VASTGSVTRAVVDFVVVELVETTTGIVSLRYCWTVVEMVALTGSATRAVVEPVVVELVETTIGVFSLCYCWTVVEMVASTGSATKAVVESVEASKRSQIFFPYAIAGVLR